MATTLAPSTRVMAPASPDYSPTSVELFAGGGGMALGLRSAGIRHVLLNEFAPYPCATLRSNAEILAHDGERPSVIEGDVRQLDVSALQGAVDVLAGGPPCQPFSLGGAHRAHDDDRDMFPEYVRVLQSLQPKVFVCENVRGLARPAFRPYLDYIVAMLERPCAVRKPGENWESHARRLQRVKTEAEYRVGWWLVNAADYGVPQIRHRVIIMGVRADVGAEPSLPAPTHSGAALASELLDGAYWERHAIQRPAVLDLRGISGGDPDTSPWLTVRDALKGLPAPVNGRESRVVSHHIGWPGARIYKGHTPNLLDRPSKTIKAGVHGVPGGEHILRLDSGKIRYYTVREVARIMTFPDEWHFEGPRTEQMRQLGNAVPVRLAESVGRHLRTLLGA